MVPEKREAASPQTSLEFANLNDGLDNFQLPYNVSPYSQNSLVAAPAMMCKSRRRPSDKDQGIRNLTPVEQHLPRTLAAPS